MILNVLKVSVVCLHSVLILVCTRHTTSFDFPNEPVLGLLVAFNKSNCLSGTSPILSEKWLVIARALVVFSLMFVKKQH